MAAAASGFAACFPRQIAEPCTALTSSAAARFRVRFGTGPLRIEGLAYGRRRISLNPRCSMNAESSEQSNNGVSSSNSGLSPLEVLKTSATDRYTKERSSIIVLGLNIHTAPVELREKFSIPEAQWPQAISELCALNHIEEAAVLSTCNRMEIYVEALSHHRGVKEVTEWMSKTSGVPIAELCKHRFLLYNENATQHLFEVASGLDSLVLGECQILSQVKQVVTIGQGVSGFGMKIGGLFKHAISVGKRVRDQTKISSGSVSVSSAAVELALTKLKEPSFADTRVSVIGAGDMGKLLIKHLVSKGCEKITIVNRTEERVARIIKEYKDIEIVYKPISELQMIISEADIIFACTKSETPWLTKEQALQILPRKTRIFIDISVPRNIDSRINDLETAQVFDVDDLKQVVSANMEERDREAEKARAIVSEEVRIFEAWKDSRESVPTIRKFSAYVERIRAAELDKCLARMGGDVSEKDKKAIYDLSMGIANKLRRGPMEHLRSDGGARCMGEVLENVRALNRIFDLHTETFVFEEKIRSKVKQKQKK